ncbi:MAG: arylesterase [Balneolales bacterium]|nr:arylesterase [Balneolales bacterium]
MKLFSHTAFLIIILSLLGATGSEAPKRVVIFGDSIAAGYGLDSDQAFPALIQGKVDEAGLPFEVVNAGLSGETSAAGLRRIDWILRRSIDVFVLELGGNDGLRGINPEVTKANLAGILDKVLASNPDVRIVLTGMEAPPNMGSDYTVRFREIFRELADAYELTFMPFILEDVAGEPELNLPDRIHPTAEGHQIIAANLWEYLLPVLEDAQ